MSSKIEKIFYNISGYVYSINIKRSKRSNKCVICILDGNGKGIWDIKSASVCDSR